jgi:hypothetical protein
VNSPSNGSTLTTGSPQIGGTVSSTAPGATVSGGLTLAVTSPSGHPGWNSTVPSWCGRSSCSFTVTVQPGLAYNGQYQLSVSAQETDPPLESTHSASWTGSFSVAVPPVSPSQVSATPAADGSSITLSWAANPEPDIVGYQVDRSPSSPGSWPQAVTGTGLVDPSVSPGQSYTYTVTAVRQGASSGLVMYSSPTSAAATDPTVTAAGTGPSGSGSSGSGSTTGSGSGSGSTAPSSSAPSSSGSTSSGSTSSGSSSSAGTSSHGTSSGQSSLGTYGKASSGSSGGSHNLSSFDQLVQKTAAAQAGSSGVSAGEGAAGAGLPALGDGSDNPAVAPFSSGSSETRPVAGGQATVSYATTTENHDAVVRDFAAVGLAALLLAVVAHLLWLRRAVKLDG